MGYLAVTSYTVDSVSEVMNSFILTQHEYGAALMADGFAETSEKSGA